MRPAAADIQALRRAAVLLMHWNRHDVPAFIECMTEIETFDEAKDVIASMVMVAGLNADLLPGIILEAVLREINCALILEWKNECVPA